MFELGDYPILEYNIYTETDAIKMVNEVFTYFEETAFSFLKELSELPRIELELNNKPHPRGGNIGLVLAKLVKSEQYDDLVFTYRNLLRDWPSYEKQQLETVIDYLSKHSTEELLTL